MIHCLRRRFFYLFYFFYTGWLLLWSSSYPLLAQEPEHSPLPALQTGIIYFMTPVSAASVGWLIAKISEYQQQGITEISILFLSPGGDTDAGIAGYQYLAGLPLVINTYNLADTSSAAAYLFCAGTRRYAFPYSKFLLHGSKTHFKEPNTLSEITVEQQQSQLRQDSASAILTACMPTPPLAISSLLNQGIVFNSAMALQAGLIEKIVSAPPDPLHKAVFTIKSATE